MPQILGFALAGAAAWAGYKWLRKEMHRVSADLTDAEERVRKQDKASIPNLRRDPETGIYTPDRS
jgi:hypothetical protein